MKIALVGLTHPFRGGIAHYTTLLCHALRERHNVRFFALKCQYPGFLFPGTKQTDDSQAPLTAANEPCLGPLNPFSWLAAAREIGAFGPDLVLYSWWHPFFAPSYGTLARLLRKRGLRNCFLCHNVIPHDSSVLDRALLRYAFAPLDACICHAASEARAAAELNARLPVHCSPHPTYEHFSQAQAMTCREARAQLGLAADRRVVLFFGFVRKYKGLGYLLQAMLDLDAEDRYHLLVVGEFYESRETYGPALAQLTAKGQVTLVDRYVPNEEIPLYFTAADLVAVPYVTATQSGIAQLAYAFEKPILATRVGGLPEVIDDGKTGYLVAPADANAIAMTIRAHFAEDRSAAFAANIRARALQYSWSRMVETVETVAAELG